MDDIAGPHETDQQHLLSLDAKLQVVRDRVVGVADGYSTGLILWGEGGTSKSYTVEDTLRKAGRPYKLTNSRITGKGLFVLLRDYPDVVHVIEDAETLLEDKHSFGVLRSALGGTVNSAGKRTRMVSWQTGPHQDEFEFTGGIVFIANKSLDDNPLCRAIGTRVPVLQYQVTNLEIAAKMREIARSGYRHGPYTLSPAACLEVAEEIIARATRLKRNLDIRLLINTFADRLQWENGACESHWHDLLDTRMRQVVAVAPEQVTAGAKAKAKELEVARRIAGLTSDEKLSIWVRETGKSRAGMFRCLRRLNLAVTRSDDSSAA